MKKIKELNRQRVHDWKTQPTKNANSPQSDLT